MRFLMENVTMKDILVRSKNPNCAHLVKNRSVHVLLETICTFMTGHYVFQHV